MDRVELAGQYGTIVERRWTCGRDAAGAVEISFGRLGDGRWWARRSDEPGGAFVYDATERGCVLALALAYRWLREPGRVWEPVPARYDGRGRPADGLLWVRSGRYWVLPGSGG